MEVGVSLPLVSALANDDIRLSVDFVPLTREHVYLGVSPYPQKGRLDDGCLFPSRFRGGAINSTDTALFGEFPSQSKSEGRPGFPSHDRGLVGLVHSPVREDFDGACALKAVRATTGDDFITAADLRCLVSRSGKGTLTRKTSIHNVSSGYANGNASTGSGLLTHGYVDRYPDLIDGDKDDRSMGFLVFVNASATIKAWRDNCQTLMTDSVVAMPILADALPSVFLGSFPCTMPVGSKVGRHIPPRKMFPVLVGSIPVAIPIAGVFCPVGSGLPSPVMSPATGICQLLSSR